MILFFFFCRYFTSCKIRAVCREGWKWNCGRVILGLPYPGFKTTGYVLQYSSLTNKIWVIFTWLCQTFTRHTADKVTLNKPDRPTFPQAREHSGMIFYSYKSNAVFGLNKNLCTNQYIFAASFPGNTYQPPSNISFQGVWFRTAQM